MAPNLESGSRARYHRRNPSAARALKSTTSSGSAQSQNRRRPGAFSGVFEPVHRRDVAVHSPPSSLVRIGQSPDRLHQWQRFRRADRVRRRRCRGAALAIADSFLIHNRQIHIRTDDSVVRVSRGREVPQRRSRGYAPQPIELPFDARRPILACGAELKNTFCVAKRQLAFVSHHIGDLENFETLRSFREGIDHFRRLFGITPEVVAFDLHPEYLSTKYALDLKGVEFVGVQHHHAHIAACLADNGEQGPAIGVAFDGLGFGLDGTIWGGEFLIADLAKFERVGHLEASRCRVGLRRSSSRGEWQRHTCARRIAKAKMFRSISKLWSEMRTNGRRLLRSSRAASILRSRAARVACSTRWLRSFRCATASTTKARRRSN